jgi:hypothetical protein
VNLDRNVNKNSMFATCTVANYHFLSASSVTSSIKAIANTLGLKRSTNNLSEANLRLNATGRNRIASNEDSLVQTSVPYEQIPHSSSLPVTILDQEPIPGEASRAGRPAPPNGRLSVGNNATSTTIRLVTSSTTLDDDDEQPATPRRSGSIFRSTLAAATPQLKAFETRYDLIAGTPGLAGARVWPPPSAEKRTTTYEVKRTPGNLYPDLPTSDDEEESKELGMPGGTTIASPTPQKVAPSTGVAVAQPAPHPSISAMSVDSASYKDKVLSPPPETASPPQANPFVFGSSNANHSVTNTQFQDAAASVLEEMNRRLAAEGVAPIAADILNRKPMGLANSSSAASSTQTKPKDKFASMHEDHFNKMDSIANHYAARRGATDKQKAVAAGMKRKSVAMGDGKPVIGKGVPSTKKTNLAAGARVISAGSRKKMLPGALDDNELDEVDNESEARSTKRQRVASEDAAASGSKEVRRVSLTGQVLSPEEVEREQKEREAIRRKLEIARARRRSGQAARQSIGMGRPTVAAKQSLARESMNQVGRPGVSKGTTPGIYFLIFFSTSLPLTFILNS